MTVKRCNNHELNLISYENRSLLLGDYISVKHGNSFLPGLVSGWILDFEVHSLINFVEI